VTKNSRTAIGGFDEAESPIILPVNYGSLESHAIALKLQFGAIKCAKIFKLKQG
jgi:hypothetical protein